MNKIIKKAIPLSIALSLFTAMPTLAYEKDETVYTKIDKDGNVSYKVVNEKITSSKKEVINDISDLTDIKNTSGKEKMTKDGQNIKWNSKGEDIFYQGKIDKELPINVKVEYTFNDKVVSFKEVKGKKGHVKLTLNYTNNEEHIYKGKTVYTPFLVMFSTTLDASKTKNLTINTGKIINNGNKELVVGLASPGLYESFDKLDDLKELDKIVIEYDTEKFDLSSMYCIATPKLIDSKDVNTVFNNIDSSFSNVDKLKEATNKLVEGSKTLADGTKTLKEGTSKLNDGANTLYNGTSSLNKGLVEAENGTYSLVKGTSSLENGTSSLVKGSSDLKTGIDTLIENYEKIDAGINSLNNNMSSFNEMKTKLVQLRDGLVSVQNGIKQLKGLDNSKETIKDQYFSQIASNQNVYYQLKAVSDNSKDVNKASTELKNRQTLLATLSSQLLTEANKVSDDSTKINAQIQKIASLDTSIDSYKETLQKEQLTLATLKNTLKEDSDKVNQTSKKINQLKASITEIKQSVDEISSSLNDTNKTVSASYIKKIYDANVKTHLFDKCGNTYDKSKDTSGYSELNSAFYDNFYKIYLATDNAAKSINSMKESYDKLDNGCQSMIDALNSSINELNTKLPALSKGTSQLVDGSSAFKKALKENLANGANSLYEGIKAVDNGSKQLSKGTQTLYQGTQKLTSGSSLLYSGAKTLALGTKTLDNGTLALVNGATTLSNGMYQYKTTGIDKLLNVADRLKADKEKFKTLTDYASSYKYTKAHNDANYKTKFITIIENK